MTWPGAGAPGVVAPGSGVDDRAGGPARLVPLFLATAASVSLAAESVPTRLRLPHAGILVGVVVSAMSVFLLGSVPARWASRGVVFVGAVLILRYGSLDAVGSAQTSTGALAWGAATAVALVMSSRMEERTGERLASTRRRAPSVRSAAVVRAAVIVVAVVGAVSLLAGGSVANSFTPRTNDGLPPRGPTSSRSPLAASDSIDMTQQPRLSDRVVMTVRTDRQSFLRDSTFDVWDGQSWRRSRPNLAELGPAGQVTSPSDDLAARSGIVVHQRIRLEAPSSDLVPAAPSAVSIQSAQPLVQWSDGDVVSVRGALGRGATYEVTSRQIPVTAAALEAANGTAPPSVARRYAAAPVATPRVRALAARITAGARTNYDKVLAIEGWMAAHTTYSINAPLAPPGRDVVDDFLFRSKEGWCEQIASSLVVLLRLNGVPTRLATGFVPGEWDPILKEYRVRERDAHAWAEVWFPSLGWVPFDPTAEVPFAGDAPSTSTASSGWLADAAWLLVALAVGAVLIGPAVRTVQAAVRRLRSRRRRRRVGGGWVAGATARLERLGADAGRPRAPWETTTAYAAALAELWRDGNVAGVGEVLDAVSFGLGPEDGGDGRAEWVARTLDELAATPRAREPAGVS